MLVVVADSLQLTASCKLPDKKLQAPPKTLTVEEHEELGHDSAEEKTRGLYSLKYAQIKTRGILISRLSRLSFDL